ncbi:CBASS cGAMP-activated phospholipase [Teredinibacter turnerae]|uniref:CBASS cGAMP-activated phospholipase n=1 Tax=Teredinibacter turnerae TaxID=2426 RepID=UPI000365CC18|nr:CBASS cGAMP-activated phospholipase [Teredinibacter turnerae]
MRFQILALSGGGVRGLYTISILAQLEQILAEKHGDDSYNIAQHFDLIAGTSIGGILALGLASGMTARKLCGVLDENRKQIFPPKSAKIFRQALGSLYSSGPLRAVLEHCFGDKCIKDLHTRVTIPAVNGTSGSPKVYKTPHHENFQIDKHLRLVDVALSTSAAPTFFSPHLMNDSLNVDGGLIANGPALIAFHEATHFINAQKANIYLMGVGTMGSRRVLNSERGWLKGWGYLTGWGVGRKLIEMTLSANEEMQNKMVEHLLGDHCSFIDEELTPDQSKSITLDNASDNAAQMLRGRGKERGQKAIGQANIMDFFNHHAQLQIFTQE